jgi:hypothetical protein
MRKGLRFCLTALRVVILFTNRFVYEHREMVSETSDRFCTQVMRNLHLFEYGSFTQYGSIYPRATIVPRVPGRASIHYRFSTRKIGPSSSVVTATCDYQPRQGKVLAFYGLSVNCKFFFLTVAQDEVSIYLACRDQNRMTV